MTLEVFYLVTLACGCGKTRDVVMREAEGSRDSVFTGEAGIPLVPATPEEARLVEPCPACGFVREAATSPATEVEIEDTDPCDGCDGTGLVSCEKCGGTGEKRSGRCPSCDGDGLVSCGECGGTGELTSDRGMAEAVARFRKGTC